MNYLGPINKSDHGLDVVPHVGFLMYLFIKDFLPRCLLLLKLMMFYDWRECMMNVLGTTKHS